VQAFSLYCMTEKKRGELLDAIRIILVNQHMRETNATIARH